MVFLLEVFNLSKSYNRITVLKNISFKIKEGEILGLLGHNGSGKTTTFKLLLGLIEADLGKITYLKKKIESFDHVLFGYLPEERSLYKDLTVFQQVEFFGRLKKMPKYEIENNLNYWLDYLCAHEFKYRKIRELSKGNQQKIQLICALIHDPKIIILDEPLSGLDVNNALLFKKLILQLKKEKKLVILSSHQYEYIEELCDYIIMLKQGSTLFQGYLHKLQKKIETRTLTIEDKGIDYYNLENLENLEYRGRYVDLVFKDDFSARKFSLAYIRKYPIDFLKVKLPSLIDIVNFYEKSN